MTEMKHSPRTFLQSLEAMAAEAPETGLSLHQILDRLEERAFGAMLFILALPCAIPFLYGVPQVVALPMLALTLQMLSGRDEPWLPEKFGTRMINKSGLERTSSFGRKWFGWLEVISHPRLTFLTGKTMERVVALVPHRLLRVNLSALAADKFDPCNRRGHRSVWIDGA